MDETLFSIIVPTYNRPSLLLRALESLKRQTFGYFEVIVSDDGSSSDTGSVIASLEDNRFKLLHNSINTGASDARNRAIESCVGSFISFLDDDDEFLPSFLSSTLLAFGMCPSSVACSWANVCNVRYAENVSAGRDYTKYALPTDSRIMPLDDCLTIGIGYGVTIRGDTLRKVGGFDSSFKLVEDTDLILKLISHGFRSTLVEEVCVNVHHHAGDRMTSVALNNLRIRECWNLIRKHEKFLAENPNLRAQLVHGIRWLESGRACSSVDSTVIEVERDVAIE